MNQRGFTLVEMIVSITMLSLGILALSSSTTRFSIVAMEAERKSLALQACEDRMARIRLHPIYQQLDSLYAESSSPILGLDGFTRATSITRVIQEGQPAGKYIDFTRITVKVSGPGLTEPISRSVTIGQF